MFGSARPETLSAWEVHKDCDAILCSRQNTFFVAQTFLVTGFATVIAAKSVLGVSAMAMAFLISVLGIYLSIIHYLITKSNLLRLNALKNILIKQHPVYELYCKAGVKDEFLMGEKFRTGRLTDFFLLYVPILVSVFWALMLLAAGYAFVQ